MEYCMAASSPLAPLSCSRSMLPSLGSGSPMLTVYINRLMWWYMNVFFLAGVLPAENKRLLFPRGYRDSFPRSEGRQTEQAGGGGTSGLGAGNGRVT